MFVVLRRAVSWSRVCRRAAGGACELFCSSLFARPFSGPQVVSNGGGVDRGPSGGSGRGRTRISARGPLESPPPPPANLDLANAARLMTRRGEIEISRSQSARQSSRGAKSRKISSRGEIKLTWPRAQGSQIGSNSSRARSFALPTRAGQGRFQSTNEREGRAGVLASPLRKSRPDDHLRRRRPDQLMTLGRVGAPGGRRAFAWAPFAVGPELCDSREQIRPALGASTFLEIIGKAGPGTQPGTAGAAEMGQQIRRADLLARFACGRAADLRPGLGSRIARSRENNKDRPPAPRRSPPIN
ncbi:Hypothetical predicted protein [Olea europaea subsp. europaea]|uniref:Uncharacterized protein n=1 Tax=Olea europaea subsp. europaea TaxID=158383 RepID=A0A8S0TK96_OLEEU|nr:Hypothetical predicted protein [Olea europaea subsp. europaea]